MEIVESNENSLHKRKTPSHTIATALFFHQRAFPHPARALRGIVAVLFMEEALSDIHHWYNPATGFYETLDIHTGEVLAVQKNLRDYLFEKEAGNLVEHELPNGEIVWIERGLEDRVTEVRSWVYNTTIASVIAAKVATGDKGVTAICKEKDMPPYWVLASWRRRYPEFSEMLENARRDRTERYHDEALETADEAYKEKDPDMVGLAKLRTDVRKWAAEKGDPDRYAAKTKVEKDTSVTFIIDTGIRRENDIKTIGESNGKSYSEDVIGRDSTSTDPRNESTAISYGLVRNVSNDSETPG